MFLHKNTNSNSTQANFLYTFARKAYPQVPSQAKATPYPKRKALSGRLPSPNIAEMRCPSALTGLVRRNGLLFIEIDVKAHQKRPSNTEN